MYTLNVPKLAAQRRSVENPSTTPERPIVIRPRTDSSASSSTPGSLFDNDMTSSSCNYSPISPSPSPSGSTNSTEKALPVSKEYKFVEVTASEAKGKPPAKNRKSSSSIRTPASCLEIQKAGTSLPAPESPPNTLADLDSQPSAAKVLHPRKGSPRNPHSVTRPRLIRKLEFKNSESYQSDDSSSENTSIRSALGAIPVYRVPGVRSVGRAPTILDSTKPASDRHQAVLEILESEDEKSDPLNETDTPEEPQDYRPEFSQYGSHKEIQTLNHDICKYILSKRKRSSTPDETNELGHVYILESPQNAPDHVKIGSSQGNPLARSTAYQRDCQLELKIVKQEQPDAILHYRYLERILHLALHPHRREYKCRKCKREGRLHIEWFEMPREKALEHVKLWRDWILAEKPFNTDGTLTDYWHWRAKKLSASMHTIRWEHWTRPVGLQRLDYVDFLIETWQKDHWIKVKHHMGGTRKDRWFWAMGLIFSLLLCLKFGRWGFWLAVAALVSL